MLDPARFLDGGPPRPAKPIALKAGPLSLQFDGAGLRYIHLGEVELIRRIYAAVRDANWGTAPDDVSHLHIDATEDSFKIEFDVHNLLGEIDFSWHGSIFGTPAGRIEFEFNGVANTTFQKNRIGFCILHPPNLAGERVAIEHADGTRETSEFPRYIAPDNAFRDLIAIRHAAGDGQTLEICCSGDIFETEDQRNWTDASFKTFCTPLSRPFPVTINAGEKISQRITIELTHQSRTSLPDRQNNIQAVPTHQPIVLEFTQRNRRPLPDIGFDIGSLTQPLSPTQTAWLCQLSPAHLRCELHLPGDFAAKLPFAAKTAVELGAELDLPLFLGDNADANWPEFAKLIEQLPARIASWAIFPQVGWNTTREVIERFGNALRRLRAAVPLGGGTPASFCELNRHRPPIDLLDFVTWSMQPQEHAFDNASLVETLAAQAATVESARQFCGGLPLVVGPITLKKRVNPYATGEWPPSPALGELPVQIDPRQATLFGAGWTLGSLKHLAESGAAAITYYELVGAKGLIESESGSLWPNLFPSLPNAIFPLYHVFADLAEWRAARVVPIRSSAPLSVEALALTKSANDSASCMLVANLSAESQHVRLPTSAELARVRLIAEHNVLDAIQASENYRQESFTPIVPSHGRLELNLPPYAYARLDLRASF